MRSLLKKARPQKLPFRRHVTRAAVALIHRDEPGREALLFIQRARREGDPWSGDMAFPGGRLQQGDTSSRDTAMRETLEETGLDLYQSGHYQTRLSDLLTRHHSRWRPMVVTPHVFRWRGGSKLILNHEARTGVWIPLDYLRAQENLATLQVSTPVGRLTFPCCRYQGYCIWGLSYSMMQEFLSDHGAQ